MYDVFVISPYTDDDQNVVCDRVAAAERYLASLTMEDVVAYSTIAAMHHLTVKFSLPNDYEYWKDHCHKMISSAKEVYVLCLDGWENSVGVQDELSIARELNKKITYIHTFPQSNK